VTTQLARAIGTSLAGSELAQMRVGPERPDELAAVPVLTTTGFSTPSVSAPILAARRML
jgi:predicted naringenin-chalcone synthase